MLSRGMLRNSLLDTKQELALGRTTPQTGCQKAAMLITQEGLPRVCGIDPACWYPSLSAREPWPGKSTAEEEV